MQNTRSFNKWLGTMVCLVTFLCTGALSAQESTLLDENLDKYWGETREIRTIQKRLFLKDTRWEFSLFSGVIPNDDFQIYLPMGARVTYYFTEDFAAEISGAYSLALQTKLKDFLTSEFESTGGTSAQIFLTQTIQWYAHADVLWSPFHGKLGLLTSKLFHFDFYVALGAGVMGLEVDPPGASLATETKITPAGNAGVGAMMYLMDFMAVRLDYRHYFHQFQGPGGGLSYPAELTLGVAFFTEAPN